MKAVRSGVLGACVLIVNLCGVEIARAQNPKCFGHRATIVARPADKVTHGTAGNDVIVGSDSYDKIRAGEGRDLICGLDEIDFIYGERGFDKINGGFGTDRSFGNGGQDRLFSGGEEFTYRLSNDVLYGGDGDDVLVGDVGLQTIYGEAGDDRLVGRGAFFDDCDCDASYFFEYLVGGVGNDVLQGGASRGEFSDGEIFRPGPGNDVVRGDERRQDEPHIRDTVDYSMADVAVTVDLETGAATGQGRDVLEDMQNIVGTRFGDVLRGDERDNFIQTSDHPDALRVGDRVVAREGDDRVWADEGNHRIFAGMGEDFVSGDEGHEIVKGGSGNDGLFTSEGRDKLFGGRGDDALSGGEHHDVVAGGGGSDEASADFNIAVEVDLATQTWHADTDDDLSSIENVAGSNRNDTIGGSDGANRLEGSGGRDMILAEDGDDLIVPGTGNDDVEGGNGSDTVAFVISFAPVDVDLAVDTATTGDETDHIGTIENVYGTNRDDVIRGDDGPNRLFGWSLFTTPSTEYSGNDELMGRDGNDYLDGGHYLKGTIHTDQDMLDGGFGIDTCLNGEVIVSCEALSEPSR
ncbi:MAG: hypothetical protein M3280_01830 [Actinomycetota bacterium]|nr:hypothetical protein [Actinomycetota bacterium]